MLVLSTFTSFVPLTLAQILSLVLLIVVLVAAYIYRAKDNEDGLLYNHMTYLIGTIWIGTSLLTIGILAASTWIYLQGDHSLLNQVASDLQNGRMLTEEDLWAIFMQYMAANKNLLVLSSIVTIGPAVLYFVYRVANGYSRACKGYRIANPKSWL